MTKMSGTFLNSGACDAGPQGEGMDSPSNEALATQQQGLVGKYHPYPEYKDSGVEWLGEIPAHWETNKLRYMFDFGKGLTITKENLKDDGIPCVNYGEVHSKYGFEVDPEKHALKCVDESYLKTSTNSLLHVGDFVFADTSEDIDGSGNFTQLTSEVVTFAGYHTIIARPADKKNHRFYAYLFDSKEFRTQIRHAVKGVKVFSITQAILRGADIWLPSQDERQQIAAFLDYETARIDRLISQQQRLIELLKEKRQAVISHAVTKGLNPDAPMKDSGVEWLGQVPEHWQCMPFGLLALKADLGGNYLGGQEDTGLPFLKMGNLGRGRIVLDKLECLEQGTDYEISHRLEIGDFLFNTRNSLDLVGKVAIWHGELEYALYNSNILRVRFKREFVTNADFMGYVFNSSSALGWLSLLAKGTTSVAAIYYKDLSSMLIPIPPFNEQDEISSYITDAIDKMDVLEQKALQAIDLMRERRTALISAAVTGKIDLRGWTPPVEEVAVWVISRCFATTPRGSASWKARPPWWKSSCRP